MMRSRWFIKIRVFSFGLLLAAFGAYLLWNSRQKPVEFPKTASSPPPTSSLSAPAPSPSAPSQDKNPDVAAIRALLTNEAQRIGQLNESPSEVEARLNSAADKFSRSDISWLKAQAMTLEAEGDERAMAIDLLSRSTSPESIRALQEIALRSRGDFDLRGKDSRQAEFELVLSAQAVDGIGSARARDQAASALQRIAETTDSAFLADRARRNLQAIEGKGKTAPEQDEEALKKVLRK